MNDGGSIVEFFYNIVPGVIFLIFLNFFGVINIFPESSESVIIIFVLLVFGLFLGFLFQGITVFLRHILNWNNRAYRRVRSDNLLFKRVYSTFDKSLNLKDHDYRMLFYIMDTRLRAEVPAFLPTHFSSLFAFWSNMFCATALLLVILVTRMFFYPSIVADKIPVVHCLYFFLIISWLFADKFLKSFYDTVLNAYYSKYLLEKEGM